MTVYVDLAEGNVTPLYFNIPNVSDMVLYTFTITSQYSHESIDLANALIDTNDRYTEIQVQFPTGFSETHKNGIYNWSLKLQETGEVIQAGLMKIITNPGGLIWTKSYDAGIETEERVSEVYYRPQYT